MPLTFTPFKQLPDVVLVEPQVRGDERGWLLETFKRSEFEAHDLPVDFRQDNHSRSLQKHTLRGLHYQVRPMTQAKLVRCSVGEIFDVAVDIRRGSPTFGQHVSTFLSEANKRMLWIPEGFAHGLLTMTEVTDVQYKLTSEYSAAHDRSVRWDDPALGIVWPKCAPLLSKKDADAPLLKDAEVFA